MSEFLSSVKKFRLGSLEAKEEGNKGKKKNPMPKKETCIT